MIAWHHRRVLMLRRLIDKPAVVEFLRVRHDHYLPVSLSEQRERNSSIQSRRGKRVRCNLPVRQLALVATTIRMSATACPRQSAHGEVGTPTEEMKHKRAEAKAAKQQRPDRHDEESFEDKREHSPAQSE